MNCEEARQQILDPSHGTGPDLSGHIESCEPCRAFGVDADLVQAAFASAPPPASSDIRIRRATPLRRPFAWVGAAAAVLMFGLVAFLTPGVKADPPEMAIFERCHDGDHANPTCAARSGHVSFELLQARLSFRLPMPKRLTFRGGHLTEHGRGAHLVFTSGANRISIVMIRTPAPETAGFQVFPLPDGRERTYSVWTENEVWIGVIADGLELSDVSDVTNSIRP